MNILVINLDVDPPLSASNVGGKAAALSTLRRAGFPAPPGLCLTTAAFCLAISPYQATINELLHGHDLGDFESVAAVSEQIGAILSELSLPAEVSRSLSNALPQIAMEDTIVAVRSSAVYEDNTTTSFAGQYDTFLGVRGNTAIEEAVLDCWRSFFNVHAISNRARVGKLEEEDGMHSSLQSLLRDPGDDCLAQLFALPQDTAVANFRQQFQDLLSIYGERHGHGYGSRSTVHTPIWREQPSQIMRLAAPYLDPDIEPPAVSRAHTQQEREERLEAVTEFKRLLANGRHWWAVLEIHNHYIDQIAGGQLRHAIMAAACWLVKSQILPEKEDVFWLTFAEILAALKDKEPPELVTLIHRRKTQHATWAGLIPPPLLGLPDPSLSERPSLSDDVTPQPTAKDSLLINGQAVAPGQVTSRARIVQDETSLAELKRGDILVARNVGPRWTPIFPLLGGLVLETGSVGQHAAVTAREYGVVAVIATGDATKRIPDNSLVFVDGTRGIVQIRE